MQQPRGMEPPNESESTGSNPQPGMPPPDGSTTTDPNQLGGQQGSTAGASEGSTEHLDDSVTFDWPETMPGGPRCEGGAYTGTWSCTAFGLVPFTGDVNLHFVESANGEFLELSDAKLQGLVGSGEFRFDAELSGRLDCTTLAFSAEVTTSRYERFDALFNTYTQIGVFAGTLTGSLDPEAQRIEGEWSLLADLLVDCVGPWSAGLTP